MIATLLVLASLAQIRAADSVGMLDSRWAYAYVSHDTTFAKRLFADDIVVTSANGTLKDKAGELADIRPTPDLTMDYFRTDSVQVKMHSRASVAIVTGIAEWRFVYRGQPSVNRRRYTAVYTRGGPLRWRMVALHLGRTADSTAPR